MKKILLIIIGVLIIMLGLIGINYNNYNNENNTDNNDNIRTDDIIPDEPTIINENYEVELIKKVNEISSDNYLISPYSIKVALNILKDGSNGNTKKEIEKLVGNKFNEIETSKSRVSIASALFIKDSYKNYIENNYYKKAKLYNADILYDKFETPVVINDWVNEKTFKMIPKILNEMDENFVLGIANAVAIDVNFLHEFECINTREEEFIKSDNTKINVEMMHQSYERNIEYFINDDIKGVIIPYKTYDKDGNVSSDGVSLEFVGILPNDGVNSYINNLDTNKLKEIDTIKQDIKEDEELYLSIPRFKYDYEINKFIDLLKSLGINDVFDINKADLTKIISKNNMKKNNINNLYVDEAIHKTHIDFNEKGTKAAAVTYFGVKDSSIALDNPKNKIEIIFNKPFVYMIRDKKTNEILFFGVVENPNEWKESTCN